MVATFSQSDQKPPMQSSLGKGPARITSSVQLGGNGRSEGVLLGTLAIAPLVIAASAVWLTSQPAAARISRAATSWSGALLAFLAGVRRGLTFSEAAGARPSEVASSLSIFTLGVGVTTARRPEASLGLAILGFASVAVLDAHAAKRRQTPGYFRALRPAQMTVACAALSALLIYQRRHKLTKPNHINF